MKTSVKIKYAMLWLGTCFLFPSILKAQNQVQEKVTAEIQRIMPFSPFIEANGKTLYISGQISPLQSGEIKTIETETKEVMRKIETILNQNGYGFHDVVRCTIFMTDMDNYNSINEIYASFFPSRYPSREAVEVRRLANGARIEISAIAIKETKNKKEF